MAGALQTPPQVANDSWREGDTSGGGGRQTQTSWQVSLQAQNWETEVWEGASGSSTNGHSDPALPHTFLKHTHILASLEQSAQNLIIPKEENQI